MNDVVLSARGVKKAYHTGADNLTVLQRIDLTVKKGDFVAVTGTSGCGKSTLLNLLAGLDDVTTGNIKLCGQLLANKSEKQLCRLRNRHLGFVFQMHHLLPEFSAIENVAMPLLIRKTTPSAAKKRAAALLDQVGLGKRLSHKPGQLSGGERQRVAIARALSTNPDLVMADEPTGNLDEKTASTVQDLLLDLNQSLGTAFLVVTHDQQFASRCFHQLRLHDGVVAPAE